MFCLPREEAGGRREERKEEGEEMGEEMASPHPESMAIIPWNEEVSRRENHREGAGMR